MKPKLELVVGKKYRGYGLLNEYGEFEFMPEETGKRAGAIKAIKQTDTYTLSTSRNLVLIHIRLPKVKGLQLVQSLLSVVNELITDLRNYEI